jgi:hypothetical protein
VIAKGMMPSIGIGFMLGVSVGVLQYGQIEAIIYGLFSKLALHFLQDISLVAILLGDDLISKENGCLLVLALEFISV